MAVANVLTRLMVDAAIGATATQAKPQDADPFCKGDFVVYPAHGLGKVDSVRAEEIAGHRLNFMQVSFAENRMTLRIPVARARAAGLRKLAGPKALAEALDTLRGRPRVSRLLWAKRAQKYLAKINSGDLQGAGEGSGSSFSQRTLFESAIGRFAGEFAAISRIDTAAALDRLTQVLHRAKETDPELTDQLSTNA